MLLALLKSVVRWVYSIFFENKIADAEDRIYFGEKIDEGNEE